MSFLRHTLNDSHPRSVEKAQEKQIYQNRVTLQTRSQKRNLRHSHTQSHYLRPPQHSQSHITRHNSSPKIFKPHSNPRSRSISNTNHIQWKSHIQNYSKHRYTRAVLGHRPRFAPRRVLFMHAHHPALLCQSFVPAQLQALSRLPQDKELRTPPSLGTNRLSGSFDRAPLKSARSLRPRPLGAPLRLRYSVLAAEAPNNPCARPVRPRGWVLTWAVSPPLPLASPWEGFGVPGDQSWLRTFVPAIGRKAVWPGNKDREGKHCSTWDCLEPRPSSRECAWEPR